MSAKSVIQNLQDSELIRLFLDFVQTFHLQYQKIDKEISYKCHEATWILATTKATGYGRTQSEAYKHALKNLLELLIEDPPYTEFFVSALTSTQALRRKSFKKDIKTEAQEEPSNKENKEKMYESSSKLIMGSYKKHNESKEEKREVYHSKISLTKSSHESSLNQQIRKAKARMRELETQLASITEQNNVLREKLNEDLHQESKSKTQELPQQENKPKVVVPKLKLEILPNYHKKSEKSLNESLLAVYNQKHGNTKKLI